MRIFLLLFYINKLESTKEFMNPLSNNATLNLSYQAQKTWFKPYKAFTSLHIDYKIFHLQTLGLESCIHLLVFHLRRHYLHLFDM